MWHFITNRSIFEVTVYSYVFANKASQSETKIENKYCQCKINIFKHLVFRKLCTMFTQCSHEHECTRWKLGCLPLLKCSANWMHIAFIAIIAMKLTILLKQFIHNLWKFIVDFPWCNDQMHCTYVDQHIWSWYDTWKTKPHHQAHVLWKMKELIKKKYYCYIGKFALNTCFTWAQCV